MAVPHEKWFDTTRKHGSIEGMELETGEPRVREDDEGEGADDLYWPTTYTPTSGRGSDAWADRYGESVG